MAATRIDLDSYLRGVLDGRRASVARAVTLVESTRADHRALAQRLLTELLPYTGGARRIGISGVPGVGKSTFIDTFGSMLKGLRHRGRVGPAGAAPEPARLHRAARHQAPRQQVDWTWAMSTTNCWGGCGRIRRYGHWLLRGTGA
ncbi:hypothetical protein QFZ82_006615 [Streptomyces sp. V4I23]|nr:hypothetical protein [Streptomyces sp. V4I23]